MARLNADRASPGLGERCRATARQIVAQAGNARFLLTHVGSPQDAHRWTRPGWLRGHGSGGRRMIARAAGSSTPVHRDTPCDAKPRLLRWFARLAHQLTGQRRP
jgi:hypothetical protein